MPNVLQLVDSFNQGGTEWQTVQITRLLHESGKYRIFLASLSSEGPLRAAVERLGFHDIPSFPLQNFYNANAMKQLAKLASLMRNNKIDLVHAHDFYTNIFGMAAAKLSRRARAHRLATRNRGHTYAFAEMARTTCVQFCKRRSRKCGSNPREFN